MWFFIKHQYIDIQFLPLFSLGEFHFDVLSFALFESILHSQITLPSYWLQPPFTSNDACTMCFLFRYNFQQAQSASHVQVHFCSTLSQCAQSANRKTAAQRLEMEKLSFWCVSSPFFCVIILPAYRNMTLRLFFRAEFWETWLNGDMNSGGSDGDASAVFLLHSTTRLILLICGLNRQPYGHKGCF